MSASHTGHILTRSCIVWRGWRGRRRGRSSQLPAELPAAEEEVLGGNIRQRHLGRPQPEPEPGDNGAATSETDSPVKPAGGKRILEDSSPTDSSQVWTDNIYHPHPDIIMIIILTITAEWGQWQLGGGSPRPQEDPDAKRLGARLQPGQV